MNKYIHRARQYYGCAIQPAGINSSGIRYTSLCFGHNLRADTLEGIKRLIRENITHRVLRRHGA